jgi:hypothetical protein
LLQLGERRVHLVSAPATGIVGGVPLLGRTVEAIVFDWPGATAADHDPPGAAPVTPAATALRRRVEALCAAGVDIAILAGDEVAVDAVDRRLRARPTGPGRLLLYPADVAIDAVLDWVAERGVGPGLVLLVAVVMAPAGAPPRLTQVGSSLHRVGSGE